MPKNNQHNSTKHCGNCHSCAENQDENKHSGHSPVMFKKRFYISLILTLPVFILSPLIQEFFKFSLTFSGDKYLLFIISSFIFFYGGWPFLKGAKDEIKDRSIGMMTLIALAIITAYFYSSAVVFGLAGKIFFWELVSLIDIMLLGHWIEMKSVMRASMALEKLSALIPDKAHLLTRNNETEEIASSELKNGDLILVKPGERVPADGVVLGGESFVNESMLTGEAKPIAKTHGAKVIGGSLNQDGSLQIKVKVAENGSYLSKVINLVEQAQASKSKTQTLADKAAFWLTIIAILTGLATFFSWLVISGQIAFAIERTATVLVITCPHALGLAIPLVAAISTSLAAQKGLLIRNRTAFENARKVSTIVFDKTGTLTKGNFGVKQIFSFDNQYSENEIMRLFAGLEKNSEHLIAKAVLKEAKKRKIRLPLVDQFKIIKGKGVEGLLENKKVSIASPGYLQELGITLPKNLQERAGTFIFLVIREKDKNILAGALNLSDSIREESFTAVKLLKKQGLKIFMLTGDNKKSAKSVADALGLDGYFAEVLPDEKQAKIKALQEKKEFVAMVGDGVNDAPALARADLGIAIGSGTDIAAETADIILVKNNPKDIYALILFGKATYRKMLENLIWAAGYNIFAIPLAAGVLAGFGILLSPALAAVLMSFSTVIVAFNAQLLQLKK